MKQGSKAPEGRQLFSQPIIPRPDRERLVIAVPITNLCEVLRAASRSGAGVEVEHVYDF